MSDQKKEEAYSVVRRQAAWELGELQAVRHMEHLVPLLTDTDVQVRGTAVAALGKMGPDAARFADQVAPGRLFGEN